MSFKAKDLQFDNSQPAFLRRLRGELIGENTDRHEQPIPRNKRMKQDDEDDAPTYVLEETNQSLTKEEYNALVSGKDSEETENTIGDEPGKQSAHEEKAPKDRIAEVGTNKKRKVAKVVNVDQEQKPEADKNAQSSDVKVVKKQKKKAKAVKLAFGDEEEI